MLREKSAIAIVQKRATMSKVIVFGGAGRTGREVVRQLLALDHTVTVFIRVDPVQANLLQQHSNLSVQIGDARNFKDVLTAIQGHNVVINIIAPKLLDYKNYPISEIATTNIVKSMQRLGIKRYIGQAGAWATDQFLDASWLMQFGFTVFLPMRKLYAYKKKEDAIVRQSGLDWTLVRCGLLTNKTPATQYRVFPNSYKCRILELPKIRRVNIAKFEVSIINDAAYYQKCPIVIE